MHPIHRYLPSGWSLIERHDDEVLHAPHPEVHRWTDDNGLTIRRFGHDHEPRFELRFFDEFCVDILPARKLVAERATSEFLDQRTKAHYHIDQVLPRLLAFLGNSVIHAAAVRSDHGAIVLLGNSGLGKSTLAASFDKAGLSLIGDDAMIMSGSIDAPTVSSVYPSLRLFPDSIAALFPSPPQSSAVMANSTKQRIEIRAASSHSPEQAPIHAIFVLEPPDDADSIDIRRLSPAELCIALTQNSFALDPSDCDQARDRLQANARVANAIAGFSLRFPREFARLPDVRSSIMAQL